MPACWRMSACCDCTCSVHACGRDYKPTISGRFFNGDKSRPWPPEGYSFFNDCLYAHKASPWSALTCKVRPTHSTEYGCHTISRTHPLMQYCSYLCNSPADPHIFQTKFAPHFEQCFGVCRARLCLCLSYAGARYSAAACSTLPTASSPNLRAKSGQLLLPSGLYRASSACADSMQTHLLSMKEVERLSPVSDRTDAFIGCVHCRKTLVAVIQNALAHRKVT